MTGDPNQMNCADFQAQLPELIGSGEIAANHPHLKNCPLCQALLADLETIAAAARDLFPGVEPPDKLWAQIESAIAEEKQAEKPPASSPASAKQSQPAT
jgi:hypothetical protein